MQEKIESYKYSFKSIKATRHREKLYLFLILISSNISFLFAQDPSFSQIEPVASYSNPSYTDFHKNIEAVILHRRQWETVPTNKFMSSFASVSIRPDSYPFGFGLSLFEDEEGTTTVKTTSARFSLKAGKELFQRLSASGGFYIGLHKKTIDKSNLYFSDQLDPVTGVKPFSGNVYFDDGKIKDDWGYGLTFSYVAGRLYRKNSQSETNTIHFIFGYSNSHSLRNESTLLSNSNEKLNYLHTVTFSSTIIGKRFYSFLFNPAFKYDIQSNSFVPTKGKLKRLVWGTYLGYGFQKSKNIFFGGLFHSQNTFPAIKSTNTSAVIIMLGDEFKLGRSDMVTLALSRDINYGGFARENSTYGAWEISLVYAFGYNLKSNIFKTHETLCYAWSSF